MVVILYSLWAFEQIVYKGIDIMEIMMSRNVRLVFAVAALVLFGACLLPTVVTAAPPPDIEAEWSITIGDEKEFNPTNTFVYSNKVAIVSWDVPPTVIRIENKNMSSTYRQHFEHLWRIAKRKPTSKN